MATELVAHAKKIKQVIALHRLCSFVFWILLVLYVATLAFVEYVGVYLTYVAIPAIVFFGLMMRWTAPTKAKKAGVPSATTQVLEATTNALGDLNRFLEDTNASLERFNRTQALIRERTATHREMIRTACKKKSELEIELKYATGSSERMEFRKMIESVDSRIRMTEEIISRISKECELEVARQRS